MKVDKGVCTTPAPKRLGEATDVVAAEASADGVEASDAAAVCRSSSKYVDKAERYGVVFSTLMENKMQAIKRQSAEYAGAKKKKQHFKESGSGSGGRMASKFIPSCVRGNSVSDQQTATGITGEDVELGLIKNGGFVEATDDDECDNGTKESQAECKSPIESSEDLLDYHADEVVLPQSKHQSDITGDDESIQSVNSIGTAFSIPIAPPLTPKPLSDARLRLLEAKSISAQSSPVLPRMAGHYHAASPFPNSNSTPCTDATKVVAAVITSSSSGRPPTAAHDHSKKTHTSITITDKIVNKSSEPIRIREPPASVLKTSTGFRPQLAPIVPTTATSSHGGFISSFNELTSSNNLSNLININLPVITSTISHHKTKAAPLTTRTSVAGSGGAAVRRPSVATSTVLEYEQRMDRKWPYSSASEIMVADSGSICSGRQDWKSSRRKFRHRGSDPVLIYPSSSGLSQCLLTMPPNQSIQIKYDDNTMYDVALELDRKSSKKNGAGSGGRKSTHRHHHHHDGYRHHHHHHHSHRHDVEHGEKRSRRHRKRILVHDLDTQRVKVIDPDDLSQRARWTIIATACLLLIMCLLLVGITLRMAPLIDDMVRQENERLMKESYERGRFLHNITENPLNNELIATPIQP